MAGTMIFKSGDIFPGVVPMKTTPQKHKRGVHVHLFGQNENGEIISALILKRASDNRFCIISGKSEIGEKITSTAYRETSEETGLIPLTMYDTGRRVVIQCKKYVFHASVYVGLIKHNAKIILNNEHIMYDFVPTDSSPQRIDITEQKKNQKFCIRKARALMELQ